MDYENIAMQLIVHSGNAKSQAMLSISLAREGNIGDAKAKFKESEEAITEAHKFQTDALQRSFEHPEAGVSMLMAHAQDHLMNAITTQALAQEIIALHEKLEELTKLVKGE